jgi:hypothetical protein
MAGDWIKMRTDLYRHPKVIAMADVLLDPDGELARHVNQMCRANLTVTRNVMRNVTVGACVTVWGVTRNRGERNGDDAILENITVAALDDIADLPGFGNAMESVGWAVASDVGVVLPGFYSKHNVQPGSTDNTNAERQRRYRERKKRNGKSNGTVTPLRNDRVEKSREENNKVDTNVSTCDDPAGTPPINGKQPSSSYGFPLRGGKTWYLPIRKLDEYRDTYADSLDIDIEFRKAREWLRDNPPRRKTATGMPKFLTGWLNRACDRAPPQDGSDADPLDKVFQRMEANRNEQQ